VSARVKEHAKLAAVVTAPDQPLTDNGAGDEVTGPHNLGGVAEVKPAVAKDRRLSRLRCRSSVNTERCTREVHAWGLQDQNFVAVEIVRAESAF
jgi:hypothetical protein